MLYLYACVRACRRVLHWHNVRNLSSKLDLMSICRERERVGRISTFLPRSNEIITVQRKKRVIEERDLSFERLVSVFAHFLAREIKALAFFFFRDSCVNSDDWILIKLFFLNLLGLSLEN